MLPITVHTNSLFASNKTGPGCNPYIIKAAREWGECRARRYAQRYEWDEPGLCGGIVRSLRRCDSFDDTRTKLFGML